VHCCAVVFGWFVFVVVVYVFGYVVGMVMLKLEDWGNGELWVANQVLVQ